MLLICALVLSVSVSTTADRDSGPDLAMRQRLLAMEDASVEVGRMSKRFRHAEGWRRHLHFGFCSQDADPLLQALGKKCLINKAYERGLNRLD